MASQKSAILEDFSIEQLQAAIESKRKSRIDDLRNKRTELETKLRELDAQIEALTGHAPAAKRPGRRAGRGGGPSMNDVVLKAIADIGGNDVGIPDIVERVKGHTSSDKPGVIVSQCLVRLKKAGLVLSTGRGLYKLSADGRKQVG
jgi:hypothetical protein